MKNSKTNKRKILIGFVVLLVMGLSVFLYFKKGILGQFSTDSSGLVDNAPNSTDYASRLYSLIISDKTITSKTDLLSAFCDVVLTPAFQELRYTSAEIYSPQKSVFLYVMCTFLDDGASAGYKKKFDKDFVKIFPEKFNYNSLGFSTTCTKDTNSCDIAKVLPDVFNTVMNEISNLKLINIYGYDGVDVDKSIKGFSDTYFGEGKGLCKDANFSYIGDVEKDGVPCYHPKAYGELKKYVSAAKSLLNNSNLFDKDNVAKQKTDISEMMKINMMNFGDFRKVLQNENVFYSLFMSYYMNAISTNMALTDPDPNDGGNLGSMMRAGTKEATRIQQEIVLSTKATDITIKMLKNIYATFATHIGLLAYQEDLREFMKQLAKIYTPIHQLSEKIINVQKK